MDDGPRESQCPELEDYDYKNDQVAVDPEIVWDLPLQTEVLKEMTDVIAQSLSMISEWSWQPGEVSADWNLVNIVLIFKKGKEDPGNYRPVSVTSVPG
ncbi:hypothetical protein BTVI_45607 [Pitangus sulphuratus]|nr:hypothetical protein BTVI_45607 [Pitangus sulphuratus]